MTQDNNRNYVAAWMDYATDKVVVLERDENGTLFRKRYNPPYYFYVPDKDGDYESIFGDKLIRAEFETKDEYEFAKRQFRTRFESDFSPIKRILMDVYYGRPAPKVNFAFLDIEVDYSQEIGFAGPTNPYGPINAVTVYQSWTGKYFTAVLPPLINGVRWDELPGNDAQILVNKINELVKFKGGDPTVVVCRDELELLSLMLDWIQEADIISGWNSEFFDIPYICERLQLAGGQALLGRLEHLGVRPPKKEMVNRYGTEEPIYKFTGRCHLDYMRLFQKFTFEGRTSYSLGNILEEEVGLGKLEYDGTLEQLYKNDFVRFVAYNFRDVSGMVDLDNKFKFIALANQMAHENTVAFEAVLGTVAYVETGIANHAHNVLKKIVHDKSIGSHDKVEGAIVMTPRIGLHEWIGSVDINSLYPNTIRSLNISPEMIVGQFEAKEAAWKAIWENTEERLCFTFERTNEQLVATAREFKLLLGVQKWAVSAYGTVFDQSGPRGVVADILGYWYSERKRLQAEKKKWGKKRKELTIDTPEYVEAMRQEEQYDLLQLTKKISMNSLYGALLNVAFRFGDERMGASVTATGRQITTHMIETIGELLTGNRDKLVKTTTMERQSDGSYKPVHEYHTPNDAIIYGDTDSCYYKTYGTNKAEAIEAADLAAEGVNDSFPAFMRDAFNCQPGFDDLIKAGRELVGVRGLFQAKKKYMVKIVDLEGQEVDKLKSMGSEIKKSDTPKIIQKFLKATVDMILNGITYDEVAAFVNEQRKEILKQKVNVFLLGVAKQVNNLDKYTAEYLAPGTQRSEKGGKLTIPGHARAACNYNALLDIYDKGSKTIRSGDKVLIFYLKPNQYKFDSIAFPAESARFPKWFEENFRVDIKKTEDRMFDSKLSGIFEALGFDVPSPQSVLTNSILEF